MRSALASGLLAFSVWASHPRADEASDFVNEATLQGQQPSALANRLLLSVPLSDEIKMLLVIEQPDVLVVHLYGQSTPYPGASAGARPSPEPILRPLSGMLIQVWLLRADGTALAHRSKSNVGLSNGGFATDMMQFSFEHIPPKDLIAVVLSVNGKLFMQEITPTP